MVRFGCRRREAKHSSQLLSQKESETFRSAHGASWEQQEKPFRPQINALCAEGRITVPEIFGEKRDLQMFPPKLATREHPMGFHDCRTCLAMMSIDVEFRKRRRTRENGSGGDDDTR